MRIGFVSLAVGLGMMLVTLPFTQAQVPPIAPPASPAETPREPRAVASDPIVAAPEKVEPAPQVIRRSYNVADLFRDIQDHPQESALLPPTQIGPNGTWNPLRGDGGGGGGGGLFGGGGTGAGSHPNEKGMTLAENSNELIKLIEGAVDPTSWRNAGGTIGNIQMVGSQLIVVQTPAAQKEVAELLADLHAALPKFLRIRATFVAVTADELKSIMATPDKGSALATSLVDPAALANLKNPTRIEAQTAAFAGQAVNVTSGRVRSVVTEVKAVVGSDVAALEPTTQLLQTGAVLELRPTVSADGKTAIVDVRSVVSQWNKADQAPMPLMREARPATRPTTMPTITGSMPDRLNLNVQTFSATARMPLGRPVLVGGMTIEPMSEEKESRQWCLIMEVVVAE